MMIQEHTPEGVVHRVATQAEIKAKALDGDREAIGEWVESKGGYDNLTTEQKDKAMKLLLRQKGVSI